jgi:hypothetical protein
MRDVVVFHGQPFAFRRIFADREYPHSRLPEPSDESYASVFDYIKRIVFDPCSCMPGLIEQKQIALAEKRIHSQINRPL